MATSVIEIVDRLKAATKMQQTPVTLEDGDYINIVKEAIRRLYVDTARASIFNKDMFYKDEETGEDMFSESLMLDEEEYVMCLAKIGFFNIVKASVNNIVGYSTDAISVTNADKPYTNIKDTLSGLEMERRIIYFKMSRFVIYDR